MAKSSTKVNFELRKLRISCGHTYESLSKELGICKAYYWQIENGNRRLYYDLAVKIANYFGKTTDEIFYNYFNEQI